MSMQVVGFALIYPLIWILSRMPMWFLHIVSDLFFLLNYHVIKYRKKVVLDNLKLAFPEKDEKELEKIRRKFFKHLIDFFIESIKTFAISEKEIRKRMKYTNIEVLEEVVKNGKNVALVGPHQANWEWLIGLPLHLDGIQCHAAYTRIKNPYFERIIKTSRSKFGGVMYRTTDTIKNIYRNYKENTQSLYCLLSDQSPQVQKTHYWSEFMGVKVPIHTGAEMLSKKYDMAYVVWSTRQVKRGYYEISFELITEEPKQFKDYELTDRFLEITEKNIRKYPEMYLWSHKRFKHRDKVPKEWQ
ncbi:lysophospholipid acyltransferase family protein [Pseudotenacibaculum haliotis]|uniref:Lysophospholipid acyltransferase family protein n=1 Tax=Pseudotenacibaculum haliotis TaxID=1862138 RepID=A0ABW5LVD0_9FLAO